MDWVFSQATTTRRAVWLRRAFQYAVLSAVCSGLVISLTTRQPGLFLWRSSVLGLAFFGAALYLDRRAEARRLRRKTLRGTSELTPEEFCRDVPGDGLGIPCLVGPQPLDRLPSAGCDEHIYLRVPTEDESTHLMVTGDTRMGKSALMHFWLKEIARRGTEPVVAYDPALEFWEHHGQADRGDLLLHPCSADCPFWDLADEIKSPTDARALAKSFLPDRTEGRPDFWDQAPQRLLAFLLVRLKDAGGGVAELLRWLSHPSAIDRMVAGTELGPLIDRQAAPQRAGVLSCLNMIAEALRLLPPDDGRPSFSFRRWAEAGPARPWVFIGSRPGERDALRPLVSAWLDTGFARLLLHRGGAPTWFFVDELPTLQRLPRLKDALQEAGKYNVRFVLGFQGRAQLEQLYEREAETLMSAPGIRVFLRTKEFAAARWCAENIGMPEQERGTDTLTTSAQDARDSLSSGTERRADYLVLPNEIQNLPRRTGWFCYGRYAVKIRFGYPALEQRNTFREREIITSPETGLAVPRRAQLRLLQPRL